MMFHRTKRESAVFALKKFFSFAMALFADHDYWHRKVHMKDGKEKRKGTS